MMVLIQYTQAVVLSIAMSSVWEGGERRWVVEPVERGARGDGVEAAEEEVHVVGFATAERGGEFAADEVGDCRGGEVDAVAHAVELGVGLDVFCELDSITSLPRESHQCMLVQRSRFIIRSLQDRSSTHSSFGGRNEREVLAGDAQ